MKKYLYWGKRKVYRKSSYDFFVHVVLGVMTLTVVIAVVFVIMEVIYG